MKKDFKMINSFFYSMSILIILGLVLLANSDKTYFWSFLLVSTIVLLYMFVLVNIFRKQTISYLKFLSYNLDITDRKNLEKYNFAIVCFDGDNIITWYNDHFKNFVIHGQNAIGLEISQCIQGFDINKSLSYNGCNCKKEDNLYTAYTHMQFNEDLNDNLFITFLKDDTELKKKEKLYNDNRVCVLYLLLDNFEEYFSSAKQSVRSQVLGEVEKIFEDIITSLNGKINSVRLDKFTAVISYSSYLELKKNKFKSFESINKIQNDNNLLLTFSIGIGVNGQTILDNDEFASQALDMALGRGGDQIVVKTNDDYEFFGESLKDSAKRNKVKSRFMSSALVEAMNNYDNVIVMGHKFADFDSVGASVGIFRMAKILDKEVNITIDIENNVSANLIKYVVEKMNYNDIFINEKEALEKITKKTLLVIVDTNSKSLVQFDSVYQKAENVVLIDHHRKVVDFINNTIISYHNPFASSTSEMVTEMLIYFAKTYKNVDNITADALMAGIALDTKQFSFKTSVSTFESASYLKSCGSDLLTVRKFFSQSSDVYRMKNEILSNVAIYKDCAISFIYDENYKDLRTVCAQVSDEMLQLYDVKSSFVVYEIDNIISVSARSFGKINVQLILEKLGGGGHATMAGAQIKNITIDEVILKIKIAINEFYQEKEKKV